MSARNIILTGYEIGMMFDVFCEHPPENTLRNLYWCRIIAHFGVAQNGTFFLPSGLVNLKRQYFHIYEDNHTDENIVRIYNRDEYKNEKRSTRTISEIHSAND